MVDTPPPDTNEKNPFHPSLAANYELLNAFHTWCCHVERSETSLSIAGRNRSV